VFVAMGERGTRSAKVEDVVENPGKTGSDVGSQTPTPRPVELGSDGSNAVKPAVGSGGSNAGSDVPVDAAGVGSASDDRAVAPKTPGSNRRPTKSPPPKRAVVAAAADDKDPKALMKQGKALEKTGDWDQARSLYQKLEKIKGYQGPALYMQAWAAFSANDTDDAVKLAMRAASVPGTQKTEAKFLYGDALYRQGEYKRAKDIFVGLYKMQSGDSKATAQRKIAACNQKLKLSESDGILGGGP
jgi:tetratricopeptide (TPR) repeat protein